MKNKKSDSKKKTKELLDQAAERLAEILIAQIELNRSRKNKKKNNNPCTFQKKSSKDFRKYLKKITSEN